VTALLVPVANEVKPTLFRVSLDELRTGLPYDALERLRVEAALTRAQVAELLGIPERTLARRKIDGRLTPAESDRVDRTTRILRLTAEVLEGEDKARAWLQKPNRGLGGVTPLSLLDTDRGTRAVEDALMAIEHGMYG
jgi:putative toxin-antitoxin system antitoxin component (TIGR02293 family)